MRQKRQFFGVFSLWGKIMEYIVTSTEMKQYDNHTSAYYEMPPCVLMERAALASIEEIEKVMALNGKKVIILAGCGNNGGDGIAIARLLLQRKAKVTVCFPGDVKASSSLTKQQLSIYEKYGQKVTDNISDAEYDIIIDSLFGIGLNRELTGIYKELIQQANAMDGYHVAIDIPSGICADSGHVLGVAFQADMTITFGYKKRGQIFYPGAAYCGRLICKEIGITEESFLGEHPQMYSYQPDDIEMLLPKRKKDGNKGSFGKVLMITGSENMSGACVLSGLSAYRTGAGLVRIVTPMKNKSVVQKKLPEAVLSLYHRPVTDEERDAIKKSILWADCIAIGPGLGTDEEAVQLTARALDEVMISKKKKKLVLDADALNIIAKSNPLKEKIKILTREKTTIIVTPHMGEFSRLTGKTIEKLKDNLVQEMMAYSNAYGVILVCKDARTLCTNGEKIYINQSGNDGMATAGSGDVLTGIITALLAQHMDNMDAACLGVYIHGVAGDRACKKANAYSLMARDMIKQLKDMF